MLNEGLILMGVGTGTVFAFLVVLWFAVTVMSNFVLYLNKIFPEQTQTAVAAKPATQDNGAELAIAIAVAKIRR